MVVLLLCCLYYFMSHQSAGLSLKARVPRETIQTVLQHAQKECKFHSWTKNDRRLRISPFKRNIWYLISSLLAVMLNKNIVLVSTKGCVPSGEESSSLPQCRIMSVTFSKGPLLFEPLSHIQLLARPSTPPAGLWCPSPDQRPLWSGLGHLQWEIWLQTRSDGVTLEVVKTQLFTNMPCFRAVSWVIGRWASGSNN